MKRNGAVIFGIVWLAAGCLTGAWAQGERRQPAPPVELSALPRFRGFNLLEKFTVDAAGPFREDDFRTIAEWGFNFARLPLDYRCFTQAGDRRRLDEPAMREIDAAVEFGLKYKVHVCLNFHRAPGYCVNPPAEARDLWTDASAQDDFASLWGAFAARYRGVSGRDLSFNLVNEPGDVAEPVYAAVMRKAVDAIRREDPYRIMLVDGRRWGQLPVSGLEDRWLMQAARGYAPMEITHYRAPWVDGAERMPVPAWPVPKRLPGFLYGPAKPELKSVLAIVAPVEKDTRLAIRVHQVSDRSRLVAKADGRVIYDKPFVNGPGPGEWRRSVFQKQWNIYQNIYDKSYSFRVPAGTKALTLENTEGDWLNFSEIRIEPYHRSMRAAAVLAADLGSWGVKQTTVRLTDTGTAERPVGDALYDSRWLREVCYAPWDPVIRAGGKVMLGECGVYNQTPHSVTLVFLEDLLTAARDRGWGWALWNLRGGFGVLDSDRRDVGYENYRGHKLDRALLELLQKY